MMLRSENLTLFCELFVNLDADPCLADCAGPFNGDFEEMFFLTQNPSQNKGHLYKNKEKTQMFRLRRAFSFPEFF